MAVVKQGGAVLRAGAQHVSRVYRGASLVFDNTLPVFGVPTNVVATQGSTDSAYVWVTWTRNDPTATSYEVLRDGTTIGTVSVTADTWDKCAFKDTTVTRGAHSYTVRAGSSAQSVAGSVTVRTNTAANVYTPSGTTRAAVQAAIDAAAAATLAAGSDVKVVLLAANTTYLIDAPLTLSASNVVIRGQGGTVLRATFTGDAANGSAAPGLLQVDGGFTDLTTAIGGDTAAGGTTLPLTSTAGLTVGDWLLVNQTESGSPTTVAPLSTVRMDPGAGWNDGHALEAQQITSLTASSVTFANPIGSDFTSARPLAQARRLLAAQGCGVENVTLEGPSVTNTNFLSGVRLHSAPRFTMADVTMRLFTRAQVDMRDSPFATFVGVQTEDQTNLTAPTSNISGLYAMNSGRSPDLRFIACAFNPGNLLNGKSFITMNRTHRTIIRHCTFGSTDTYGVNEHGYTSRRIRVENCYFAPGSAKFAGVFLGNEDFGFGADMIVRNCLQDGGQRFVQGRENSFGVRVLDNVIRNLTGSAAAAVDIERLWAGPDTVAAKYGSSRWVIRRNKTVNCAGHGVRAAQVQSTNYPFNGIRDVLIASDNDWSGSAAGPTLLPTAVAGPVTSIATWDAGTESWIVGTGSTLAHETATRHEGAGALSTTKTFPAGVFSNSRPYSPVQATLDKRGQGDTIGAWVWLPTTASGTDWSARMNIQNTAGVFQASATYVSLIKGQWVFVSWLPGDAILTDVKRYAVEIASSATNLTVNETVTVLVDTYEQGDTLRSAAVVENVGASAVGSWATEELAGD